MKLLPQLYKDLSEGKLDTMKDHKVEWTHVNMTANAPSTELDRFLLNEMSTHAAKGVHLQCSREYWDQTDSNTRSTQLDKLSDADLSYLPTNNLVTERYLATFGYLASLSAKRSNKFFKATRIRDDLMFWGAWIPI